MSKHVLGSETKNGMNGYETKNGVSLSLEFYAWELDFTGSRKPLKQKNVP